MATLLTERLVTTIEPQQDVPDDLLIDWNGWFALPAVREREPVRLPEVDSTDPADSSIDQLYGFLLQQSSVEPELVQTPQGRHSSRRLGSNALSVGDLIERQSAPMPTQEAEAVMPTEAPRESRLRRAGRFIRNLLRSGPNLPEADLNPAYSEDWYQSAVPAAPPYRIGEIPESVWTYQSKPDVPYEDWDGRDYVASDQECMTFRSKPYLFTHPGLGGGWHYHPSDVRKKAAPMQFESDAGTSDVTATFTGTLGDYITPVSPAVIEQIEREQVWHVPTDQLARVA